MIKYNNKIIYTFIKKKMNIINYKYYKIMNINFIENKYNIKFTKKELEHKNIILSLFDNKINYDNSSLIIDIINNIDKFPELSNIYGFYLLKINKYEEAESILISGMLKDNASCYMTYAKLMLTIFLLNKEKEASIINLQKSYDSYHKAIKLGCICSKDVYNFYYDMIYEYNLYIANICVFQKNNEINNDYNNDNDYNKQNLVDYNNKWCQIIKNCNHC